MTTTPTINTAQTWRDPHLFNQLTERQQAQLDAIERTRRSGEPMVRDQIGRALTNIAKAFAADNALAAQTEIALDHLPNPAGAVSVSEWRESRCNGQPFRRFTGSTRGTETYVGDIVRVRIIGEQHRDGAIDRYVYLATDTCMNAADARVLARDLLDAADELDEVAEVTR